jgi:predicted transcriptional regulator
MTLTVEIEEKLQQSLEEIARENGKQVDEFVLEIIDDYVDRRSGERFESNQFMKLAETSFNEWDNNEDAVYDNL